MKKTSIFFIIFLFISKSLFANKIDSLKSDKEVIKFFNSLYQPRKGTLKPTLRSTERIRTDLKDGDLSEIKNWGKVDLNQDGKMDLITIIYNYGYKVYAIMDWGDNNFKIFNLSKNHFGDYVLPKPIKINQDQLLKLIQRKIHFDFKGQDSSEYQIDTLTFKFGNFIEVNTTPSNYDIDSIIFKTSGCYGSCPVYGIKVDKLGSAEYDAIQFNKSNGKFRTIIKREDLEEIFQLINYLSIKILADNYSVNWTDDETGFLTIKFHDGSIKRIMDYGMIGTFGLSHLYNLFFQLRTNQNWK